jgi:hypothetical protein
MANIGSGTSRVIIDPDGEAATVTNNKLDVNATLVAGATIDIGDVDMFLDGGTAILGGTGDVAAGVLRVTLASNDEHFGEVGTAADIDGTIHGQLRYIADNLRPLPEGHDVTIDNESGAAAVNIQDGGNTITVDGTVAVNTISGFATESKQPSLGTAGSASANVITVQGIASMTPLVVDLGSNNDVTVTNDTAGNLLATVTQASAARTVTGTVTANAGTNLNTSALSTHAKQDTIITHLSEIEGAVETIEAAVDTQMQVDVVAISAQSDGTYIGDIKFGESLPAGSNTIGVVDLGSTDNAVLDAIDTVLDTIKVDTEAIETAVEAIQVDAAAIETLLTAANVDHAANEALLITIDSDTNAIKNAVETIDNAISGSEMQVDVVASLPAGTNAIGKLSANDGVDIGDVDVTSISGGTNAIGRVGHDITGGADGVTLVSTAGTDVVLASSTTCKKVDIQAQTDNTGLIAVGFTGVDATEATGTGIILESGDTYSLEINNLNLIYIDSTVSGEGVRYTYYT